MSNVKDAEEAYGNNLFVIKKGIFMDIIYWIVALWVIVGLIVAVAFGFVTDRGRTMTG